MTWQPNLPQLRAFMTVARSGSFGKAARNMNLSQPALSRTIRLLEEQFGTRLFDRDTRNVRLTAAGEALRAVVARLLDDFDHAFSELSLVFAGERGRVVVGTLPSLAARFLPQVIASFLQSHPAVEIVVKDTLSGDIEQQFQDSRIDLALIARGQDSDGMEFTPIATEAFGLVCRRDDPLAAHESCTWADLGERPFIAMSAMSSVRSATDEGMALAGMGVKPLYECAHLSTVGGLIDAGLGVSALPLSTLALLRSEEIVWRPLESPVVSRTIGLARLAHRALSPAADAFSRALVAQGTAGLSHGKALCAI